MVQRTIRCGMGITLTADDALISDLMGEWGIITRNVVPSTILRDEKYIYTTGSNMTNELMMMMMMMMD